MEEVDFTLEAGNLEEFAEFLKREQLTDDDSFKREALGIWDSVSSSRVIDEATWAAQGDPASMAIELKAADVAARYSGKIGEIYLDEY